MKAGGEHAAVCLHDLIGLSSCSHDVRRVLIQAYSHFWLAFLRLDKLISVREEANTRDLKSCSKGLAEVLYCDGKDVRPILE